MILNDKQIEFYKIVDPFTDKQIREVGTTKVISFGLGSYGYDIRLGNRFKIFRYPFND